MGELGDLSESLITCLAVSLFYTFCVSCGALNWEIMSTSGYLYICSHCRSSDVLCGAGRPSCGVVFMCCFLLYLLSAYCHGFSNVWEGCWPTTMIPIQGRSQDFRDGGAKRAVLINARIARENFGTGSHAH